MDMSMSRKTNDFSSRCVVMKGELPLVDRWDSPTASDTTYSYLSTSSLSYRCPCGHGVVKEERDDSIGHRDHYTYIACDVCDKEWDFVPGLPSNRWCLWRVSYGSADACIQHDRKVLFPDAFVTPEDLLEVNVCNIVLTKKRKRRDDVRFFRCMCGKNMIVYVTGSQCIYIDCPQCRDHWKVVDSDNNGWHLKKRYLNEKYRLMDLF